MKRLIAAMVLVGVVVAGVATGVVLLLDGGEGQDPEDSPDNIEPVTADVFAEHTQAVENAGSVTYQVSLRTVTEAATTQKTVTYRSDIESDTYSAFVESTYEPVNQTELYVTSRTRHRKLVLDGRTQYEKTRVDETGEYRNASLGMSGFGVSQTQGQSLQTLLDAAVLGENTTKEPETSDGELRQLTVLEFDEGRFAREFVGDSKATVRDVEGSVHVGPDGVIHRYEFVIQLGEGGSEAPSSQTTITYRGMVTKVGSTSVEKPVWTETEDQDAVAPQAEFRFEVGRQGQVTVKHTGGHTFDSKELVILTGSEETVWQNMGESVGAGDEITVQSGQGKRVRVVWVGENLNKTLDTFVMPSAT